MKNTVLGRCAYRGAFVFFEEKNGGFHCYTIYPWHKQVVCFAGLFVCLERNSN